MRRAPSKDAGLLLALALAGASSFHGAPNYVVGGVVVDSQSHAALKNVLVSLAPTAGRDQKLEQVTKQDGRFSFPVSQAGKYHLQITKPGYPPQSYRQAGSAGVSSAVVVRDDQDTRHIVFEASRGSVISGEIKDQDSEPVGNALVSIFQSLIVVGERKVIVRDQTRTNAAGEFRFSNLPRGNYYVCAMGRPWFADSLTQLEDLQDFEPSNDQPTDPDQKSPKLEYSPDQSQVDADGNFSFRRLPADRYEMAAGSRDYVAAYLVGTTDERLPPTLEVTSGEPVHRDLMLTRPASAIEGTVEASGVPQVGAFVLLMPKNPSQRWANRVDQTDSDGSFSLSTIPRGDYRLIALSDGADVAYRDAKVAAILARAAKPVHIEPGDHLDIKLDVVASASLNLPPP